MLYPQEGYTLKWQKSCHCSQPGPKLFLFWHQPGRLLCPITSVPSGTHYCCVGHVKQMFWHMVEAASLTPSLALVSPSPLFPSHSSSFLLLSLPLSFFPFLFPFFREYYMLLLLLMVESFIVCYNIFVLYCMPS